MKLAAVIFDMDGVLIDSEYSYFEAKDSLLKAAGKTVPPEYHAGFMGTSYFHTWSNMKEELGLSDSPENYIAEMIARREQIIARDGIRPIPGAPELIKRLAGQRIPLAVASSSPLSEIKKSLTAIGIYQDFTVITSGEEVQHSKPAPDVYLLAAERLGVDPVACLAVEDSPNGCLAVKAAGMVCLGYANPAYPKLSLTADVVVSTFAELNLAELRKIFQEYHQ